MRKSKLFICLYILCAVVVLINSFFFIKDEFFYDIENLPEGKFVFSSLSPLGDKTALLYCVETPQGQAVRVELVEFNTDMTVKREKNIYWEIGKNSVTIYWENDKQIVIDGVVLNISKNEVFDGRRY